MRTTIQSLAAFAALFCTAGSLSAADNWPEFRGPTADGKTDAKGLPVTFSDTEHVAWKTPIPGKAWSSPVIWGDQIWVSNATPDGKQLFAVCLDKATGKIVFDIKVFDIAEPQFCHEFNSYGSPTPAIGEGRVYVHFGVHGTACLDTKTGKVLWTRQDFPCNHFRGPGSSPILYENLMIVNFDGFDLHYVVALDKETGKTVWKTDRNIDYHTTDGDLMKAFCTPTVFVINGKPQLVNPSASATIAYEPKTGKEIWRVLTGGMNAAARPLMGSDGVLYLNSSYDGFRLYALKPEGTGDITKNVLWKMGQNQATRSSQILHEDAIYMIGDAGVASCVDTKTGKVVWSNRIQGKYTSSPLFAEGRIYFFGEDGEATVIEASRTYKKLAGTKFPAGVMASPAVSGKALFVRTKTHLYRIEEKL